MRFLHVNHRYAPFVGGSERYMQEISEHLARRQHEVHVVTSDAFDLEYFWDRRRARVTAPAAEILNGVSVLRTPVGHLPFNSVLFPGVRRIMGEASRLPRVPAFPFEAASTLLPQVPGLKRELERVGKVDLVHAANLGLEGPGVVAREVARRADVPFMFTPFIHLGREGDPVAQRYVSMPHQRKLLGDGNGIICMTEIEASFVESLNIDRDRIFISGVGVDVSEISGGDPGRFRAVHGIRGRMVGAASAVAFDKGSRDLVLAVSRLRSMGHNVELVLAGPRLWQFDRWFNALDEHVKQGVHLPGFISAADKRDMLAALDMLAMPSRTESFGIAYLEGWANRKPVVAANAGAVPEIVRHGQNGLLVEFGDPEGLASAILTLLGDMELATRLGDAGHRLVLERYTWGAVLQRVTDAYATVLGINRGGVAL